MNLSSTNSELTGTKVSDKPTFQPLLSRLAQHLTAAGLGILGGATGVAGAIGLAIIIQFYVYPATVYSPAITTVAITATLLGLGCSWLISRIAFRLIPGLSRLCAGQGLQVVLVFSILASLLQSFLFLQGL